MQFIKVPIPILLIFSTCYVCGTHTNSVKYECSRNNGLPIRIDQRYNKISKLTIKFGIKLVIIPLLNYSER